MSGYRELREGYSLVMATGKTAGTRVFIDKDGGSASLPELGDPFSVSYLACKCATITVTEYHFESEVCKYKYVCTYSTQANSTGGGSDPVPATDVDQYVYSGGSEMVSIEDPEDWYWLSQGGATGARYSGRMFKNTVRGSVSKTVTKTKAGFDSYIKTQIYAKIGTINNSNFLNFSIGTVLFSNFDARLVLDSEGLEEWEITLNFAYRILKVGSTANHINSWNYYLNPSKESPGDDDWQLVVNHTVPGSTLDTDTDLVYKTSDFDGLI